MRRLRLEDENKLQSQRWTRTVRARPRKPQSRSARATLCLLFFATPMLLFFFFFNYPAPPEIYPFPLHAALPIFDTRVTRPSVVVSTTVVPDSVMTRWSGACSSSRRASRRRCPFSESAVPPPPEPVPPPPQIGRAHV